LIRLSALHRTVRRTALALLEGRAGRRDEGMTTLEVLIIAAGLIALGIGAVALIGNTASGAIGHGAQSPTVFLTH
jgi:hypothetical protein